MKKTTVIVAIPLEDEQLGPIHTWAEKNDWSSVESVHFIHVVKQVITTLEFGYIEVPDEENFQEMKPTLDQFLRDEAKKILPADFNGQVSFHLEHSFNPEETINELIKKVNADVLVVGTRGKHGLDAFFDHSLSQYMVKHAPCDVFVVRP